MENGYILTEIIVMICSGVCSLAVWKFKKQVEENERKEKTIADSLEAILKRLQEVEDDYRVVKDTELKYAKQINEILERIKGLEDCQFIQLKDRLIQALTYYVEQGFAPIHIRENMTVFMQVYEGKGGDGYVHYLYDSFLKLPSEKQDDK